jgi:S-adenosylmethionine:tRNA ribosyltransferase-isomerase
MHIDEFDFELPLDLIAHYPAPERSASRLLHLDAASGGLCDWRFADLPRFVQPGDVLVFNDTRVIKARLFGTKASGGKVELLVERLLEDRRALVMLRASHPPKAGQRIAFKDGAEAVVRRREGDLFELEFDTDIAPLLERIGSVPLPPYIQREARTIDEERYQTVYAVHPGAVAAPTAGLHFDQAMLDRLREVGARLATITLHVGAGTFQPIRVNVIDRHIMHSEWYRIPEETAAAVSEARSRGHKVLAIGTTSLRALESAWSNGTLRAGNAETSLFIRPGYRFEVVDCLLTNFHLPRSTLYILVAAFAGLDAIRRAYRHAIERRYRFFSYGDAMLIERAGGAQRA